ncbi:MFS transporter [Burkholderia multivorans]|uniref:MFS transporter n=1 Tax=Burkholderia multivorans TaxID=87883 RepID=UPI001C246FB4|nr:MFS transporter [Burkholderia multivorans]MCO8353445.1 MFS transporter [Burkholderia multivorans]MCO8385704.1 MFS transporter [Burkholderia multivorans]MCO8406615.1 MFS transporter [Burkholderia multivorans]MCO8434800.1 MFS transporter [Burkholderia multivorans]
MSDLPQVDIKAFIDERGVTARQWLLALLCFLVVAADGVDVAMMGFVAPPIIHEWHITRASFGLVMSTAPFGLVLGALVAGPSSDRLGRRKVLIASVLLFGVCSLLTALSASLEQMMVMRFVTGIGLGAAMPNATTLLSEYVPERRRSLLITSMFIGFGVGSALVGFVAGWLIPHLGWRSVLVFGGVLPVATVPLLFAWLPESVRFMLVRGYPRERIAATLNRVCRADFSPATSFFAPEPATPGKGSIGVLFARGYGVVTISLWVTYFMGLLVIYLITGWLPTLIRDAGLPIDKAADVTAMFQTGGIAGAVLAGWAMDRLPPVSVIAVTYAGGALCVLGLGTAGAMSGALPLWMLAAGFFMNGAQTGLNAYAPVCYPTKARATGVSWMLGIGRCGSILGSAVGGLLIGWGYGFGALLSMLAIPAGMAAVAIIGSRFGGQPDVSVPASLTVPDAPANRM